MAYSRRVFLQHAAAAAAMGLVHPRPGRQFWALAPVALFPEPDEAQLQALALTALEAARTAGASFADIRLGVGCAVVLKCRFSPAGEGRKSRMEWPELKLTAGYGVRAIVDGAWGFASGQELTADAVAAAARTAVAGARINRPRRPRTLELAPAPRVERGQWATPIERDPLAVPLGEQADLMRAALGALAGQPGVSGAILEFAWRRPTTVFASTEGTLLVQRLSTALPGGSVTATLNGQVAIVGIEGLGQGGYGYEAVGSVATLAAAVRQAAERATAEARAPRVRPTSVEVGRYDLVLGPAAVATLLTETLAAALDLERALGYEANREGTSFAAPPVDMLGRYQIASPLVTVQADRTQVHGAATVGWDEEGVPPEAYTLIQEGVVVDYHTSRQSAMELAAWYRARGEPLRAHGCVRHTGSVVPAIRLPNLTLVPGPGSTTVEDLIADTKRGFYIEGGLGGGVDQQLLSLQYGAGVTSVRRITNGQLSGPVRDCAFQALTPQFWKGVDGLGGAASAAAVTLRTDPQAAWSLSGIESLQPFVVSTIRTVPLRVRQVTVLNTGRTA